MPVEIKELIVRAIVTKDRTEAEVPAQTPEADASQALVEACVRQVLTILKRSKER